MEAWKVILLVAALPLLGGAGLAWMNGEALKAQIDDRIAQQDRVDQAKIQLAKLEQDLRDTQERTRVLQADTQTRQNMLVATNTSISEADLKIKTLSDDIMLANTEIARYEKLKRDVGEIEQIEKNMAMLRESINQVDGDIDNANNLLAVEKAKKEETQADIDRRVTEDKNRKAGIITKDINTVIKAAFNDWGFVTIDAGDADGIVMNATLDITRQGKPICKVLVTDLEPKTCSASIIKSSLQPGQLVQPGDTVSKPGAAAAQGAQ